MIPESVIMPGSRPEYAVRPGDHSRVCGEMVSGINQTAGLKKAQRGKRVSSTDCCFGLAVNER